MIAPSGSSECTLLLNKATNERQSTSVGNQIGGKVGFFLFTDDFWRDYNMVAKTYTLRVTQLNMIRERLLSSKIYMETHGTLSSQENL